MNKEGNEEMRVMQVLVTAQKPLRVTSRYTASAPGRSMSLIFIWVLAVCAGVKGKKWPLDVKWVLSAEKVDCDSVKWKKGCVGHCVICWRVKKSQGVVDTDSMSAERRQQADGQAKFCCTQNVNPGRPHSPTFTDSDSSEEREDRKYDEDPAALPSNPDSRLRILVPCLTILLLCVAAAVITIIIKKRTHRIRGRQKVLPAGEASPGQVPQTVSTIYATANNPDGLANLNILDHFYEEIPNKSLVKRDAQEDAGYSTVGPSNQDQQGQSEGQKPTEGSYSLLGLPFQ
ncbi:uncharacterized protein LOC128467336 [Spea bombifrons]|uniref:uncharacterized protein LOC128467336 n=1 Tax=Spea bombifrons TaxID=233779 RepID=UPI00234B98BA|nr:uncharacterized protein LOC128467336 [Spea bombifrons]